MQIVLANITLVIIFTTIYSYGISILNLIHRKEINDVFFKFLIGYIFIGTLAVIYHFFFEINDFFSLLIIIFILYYFL